MSDFALVHLVYAILTSTTWLLAHFSATPIRPVAQFQHWLDVAYFGGNLIANGSPTSNLHLCFAVPLLSASVTLRTQEVLKLLALILVAITMSLLAIILIRFHQSTGTVEGIIGSPLWNNTIFFVLLPRLGFWGSLSVPLLLLTVTREQLQQSQTFYRSLLETVPQMVFRKDSNALVPSGLDRINYSRFTYGNPAFCRYLGLDNEEDIVNKTDLDFFPKALADEYRLNDLAILSGDLSLIDKDETNRSPLTGVTTIVHVVKTPIKNSIGRIQGLQCMFWSIQEDPKQRERLLRWFMHDTPKPLHIIRDKHIEKIRLLADKQDPDRRRIHYHANMIADLVQFVSAQFQAYGILANSANVSGNRWEALTELEVATTFKRYGDILFLDHPYILFNLTAQPKNLTIIADECKIIAMFWILVENSMKSVKAVRDLHIIHRLPESAVPSSWVGAVSAEFSQKPGMVLLTVTDNGLGFDQEEATRIRGFSSNRFGSTGFGLQIINHFVNLAKGEWTCSSNGLYKGATFTFCIPVPEDILPNKK